MRAIAYMLVIGLMAGLGGCTTLPDRQTVAENATQFINRTEAMLAAQRDRIAEAVNDIKADSQTARRNEVNNLFRQPRIDPLTDYLQSYSGDPRYVRERALVSAERDKRCAAVAERYATRAATRYNLQRLENGYRRSCPVQVAAFERRVNPPRVVVTNEPEQPVEPPAPAKPATPKPESAAREQSDKPIEPSAAPIAGPRVRQASPSEPVASEAASSCYLLYAIKNYQEAHSECLKAARAGDAKAQHHLADIALISKEQDAALHWARQSAEQDHPAGQLLLADLLQRSGSEAEALQLLRKAADQGLAEADYRIGQAYLNGQGADADPAEAIRFFERAAQKDHVQAQLQLAELYSRSKGADQTKARAWLTRAAEQESAEAQFKLGLSFHEGRGGPADNREAYIWLSRAMLNGNERARAHLERIAPELSAEQLGEAQAQVQSGLAGRRP